MKIYYQSEDGDEAVNILGICLENKVMLSC